MFLTPGANATKGPWGKFRLFKAELFFLFNNQIKGSMHLTRKNFCKKYHPVTFSPGFSGQDGYLENVLGLVCLYCEFFEYGRGPLITEMKSPEDEV